MKSKQFYRYAGIVLIIIPFIGLYQYLKNTIYIIIGVALILSARAGGMPQITSKPIAKAPVRRPAIRKDGISITEVQKEKEL